jgi:hypothetical protein
MCKHLFAIFASFPLGIHWRVGLLGHIVVEGQVRFFFRKFSNGYIILHSCWQYVSIPLSRVSFAFFYYNCGFWFAFTWWLVMLTIFHTLGHSYVFLWKMFIHIICPFWKLSFGVLLLRFSSFLYTLNTNPLSVEYLQIFSSILQVICIFSWLSLFCAEGS